MGPVYSPGRCGSGGKSCCLAVGGLPVRSHPGRFEVSLSKTPNPQLLLTSWLVPCMAANRRWCVNVCVNVWMRGLNCKALWIKALYKCSPFTIYSGFRMHSDPFTFCTWLCHTFNFKRTKPPFLSILPKLWLRRIGRKKVFLCNLAKKTTFGQNRSSSSLKMLFNGM